MFEALKKYLCLQNLAEQVFFESSNFPHNEYRLIFEFERFKISYSAPQKVLISYQYHFYLFNTKEFLLFKTENS